MSTGVYATTGDGGPASSAALKLPYSLYMDNKKRLFVSLYNGRQVRLVDFNTASNTITTFAGTGATGVTGDDGPATSATLSGTPFVCGDRAGNVFIASSNRVRVVSPQDEVINSVAGS
eukprot:gene40633-50269_t